MDSVCNKLSHQCVVAVMGMPYLCVNPNFSLTSASGPDVVRGPYSRLRHTNIRACKCCRLVNSSNVFSVHTQTCAAAFAGTRNIKNQVLVPCGQMLSPLLSALLIWPVSLWSAGTSNSHKVSLDSSQLLLRDSHSPNQLFVNMPDLFHGRFSALKITNHEFLFVLVTLLLKNTLHIISSHFKNIVL